MLDLAHRLLPLYAHALDLPGGWFDEHFVDPSATLRLSHYPVIDHEDSQWGLAPHTDSTFMTLLPANDVPGLWIRPEGYDWIEPPALPQSFLINSGDILRRWTNDRFLSTGHRVMNASGKDRFAMPFFYGARDDALIEAIPTCVSGGNPATPRPHHLRRLPALVPQPELRQLHRQGVERAGALKALRSRGRCGRVWRRRA